MPLQHVTVQTRIPPAESIIDTALLRQELPAAAAARIEGRKLVVDARVEHHERLAELLQGVPFRRVPADPATDPRGSTRFVCKTSRWVRFSGSWLSG